MTLFKFVVGSVVGLAFAVLVFACIALVITIASEAGWPVAIGGTVFTLFCMAVGIIGFRRSLQ